ncbi:OmpP1/FadL family transporter [Hymenobacter humi]|uniref:OmpP1/FadL family transporter n=1 Tax=Hymenobacter humi TaxID=1411620 RepID=A0ABW2U3I1_9BACT
MFPNFPQNRPYAPTSPLFTSSLLRIHRSGQRLRYGPAGCPRGGLGGASTAYIGSIAGISTNPGLLGHWGDSLVRVSTGGMGQIRRSSFIGQDTYQRTDQELAILPGGYFYATGAVSKRVALGLAVTTPYGYHTKWPNTWEGRSVIQESQLNTVFVQPTVGFKLNDNFNAGVGLVYAFGKYSQRRALGQYDGTSAQAQLNSSGSGLGLNVGLYGRTGDNLAFGISYRSGVKLKMNNGKATTTNIPERDAAVFPLTSDYKTEFNLPSTLAVGIADRITEKLVLTFDFTLSGWSTMDSLKLEVAPSGSAPQRRVTTARRYEDALAFRVGAEYHQPQADRGGWPALRRNPDSRRVYQPRVHRRQPPRCFGGPELPPGPAPGPGSRLRLRLRPPAHRPRQSAHRGRVQRERHLPHGHPHRFGGRRRRFLKYSQ